MTDIPATPDPIPTIVFNSSKTNDSPTTQDPVAPIVEEPVVEEIMDSEVEDDSTPLINKVGHVISVPAMGIGHAFTRTHRAFRHRLQRTNDIRRGRKFVATAQRKALADIGEKQRNDANT